MNVNRTARKYMRKANRQLGKAARMPAIVGKKTVKAVLDTVTAPVRGAGKIANGVNHVGRAARDLEHMMTAGFPAKDDIIIVCDARKAEYAAENIFYFLRDEGYPVFKMSPGDYIKSKDKLLGSKAVIIGHHDLADAVKGNVTPRDLGYGMRCGIGPGQCVLTVRHRKLEPDEKKSFSVYYQEKVSQYRALAERYSVPPRLGMREKTKQSQYDLLWVLFVKEHLPEFLGEGEAKPPPCGAPQRPSGCVQGVLEQFKREAPGASCLTDACLRARWGQQRRPLPTLGAPMETEWESLLEREGWRFMCRPARNLVCVLDPDGGCRASGTAEQILSPILNEIHARRRIETLKTDNRLEYGIVFDGGGARGAFQIGVWKWLEEHGLAGRFTGVAGASVGALNSLLFVQGDCGKAERVWMDLERQDLIQFNDNFLPGLSDFLAGYQENLGLLSKSKLEQIVRDNISLEALEDKLVCISLSELTAADIGKLVFEVGAKCQALKQEGLSPKKDFGEFAR